MKCRNVNTLSGRHSRVDASLFTMATSIDRRRLQKEWPLILDNDKDEKSWGLFGRDPRFNEGIHLKTLQPTIP